MGTVALWNLWDWSIGSKCIDQSPHTHMRTKRATYQSLNLYLKITLTQFHSLLYEVKNPLWFAADPGKNFLQVSRCRTALGRATTELQPSEQASVFVSVYTDLTDQIQAVCGNRVEDAHVLLCALLFPDPAQQPCKTVCDGKVALTWTCCVCFHCCWYHF